MSGKLTGRAVSKQARHPSPSSTKATAGSVPVMHLDGDQLTHPRSCTICQEPVGVPKLEGVTEKWAILPCGHLFGGHCIKEWLGMANEPACPTCRTPIKNKCGHPALPRLLDENSPTFTHKVLASLGSEPPKEENEEFAHEYICLKAMQNKPCAFCRPRLFLGYTRRPGLSWPLRAVNEGFKLIFWKKQSLEKERYWRWKLWREKHRDAFSVWWGQQAPGTKPAVVPKTAAETDEEAIQRALAADAQMEAHPVDFSQRDLARGNDVGDLISIDLAAAAQE